tara:strand:- start:989 stop:1402 length:414 start_codon:yes stop_codon:yes gene_type:complete
LYTAHSWLGFTAYLAFSLQFLGGFISYGIPNLMPLSMKKMIMPWHVFAGTLASFHSILNAYLLRPVLFVVVFDLSLVLIIGVHRYFFSSGFGIFFLTTAAICSGIADRQVLCCFPSEPRSAAYVVVWFMRRIGAFLQ